MIMVKLTIFIVIVAVKFHVNNFTGFDILIIMVDVCSADVFYF